MAMSIRDFDGGFGVFIEGSGVVSDQEYGGWMTAHLTQDADKLCGYAWALSDYSRASGLDVTPATVERVAGLCVDAANSGVNAVVAIVVPSDAAFGLSRMFEALAAYTGWTISTFRSLTDAVAWIRCRLGDQYCRELIESLDIRAGQVGV